MHGELIKHFPNISIPVIDQVTNCYIDWVNISLTDINALTREHFEKNNYRIGNHIIGHVGFKFFSYHLVTEEFSFHPEIKNEVKRMLSSVSNRFKSNPDTKVIFVSVHVRRTDYEELMLRQYGGLLASKGFYVAAMNQMKREKVTIWNQSNKTLSIFIKYKILRFL